MFLQTKVSLLTQCTVPISGFPLDELVLEIKNVFDTRGLPGMVDVLVSFFDTYLINKIQSNPQQFYTAHGLKPCCKEFKKLYRCKTDRKKITSVIGCLTLHFTRLKCTDCKASFVPMRIFLKLDRYQSKTRELEKKVLETVSEQSYRKSSDDIERYAGAPVSKSTIHSWVFKTESNRMKMTRKDLLALIADGTGYKRFKLKDQKLDY